jgi:hypothetical protein
MGWLDKAREVVEESCDPNSLDQAVYLVMSGLNDMLHAGEWEEIDALIEELNPEYENLDILFTFLMSTSHCEAPKKLNNRTKLYDESYDRLSKVITTQGVMEALKKEQ